MIKWLYYHSITAYFMPQGYKFTTFISLVLIFLLPIFFIPGGALAIDSAKSALFSLGTVLMALTFLFESWRQGGVVWPKHYIVTTVAALPLVYLLSALLSTPSSLSLIGYGLEVGTFGYILLGSSALIIGSVIYSDNTRVLQAFVALLASLSVVALFMLVKLLTHGNSLNLGVFSGVMANPLGSWTDLSVAFGLLAVFASLVIGMIPMKSSFKLIPYVVYLLSLALLVIFSFPTALILTLGASVLVFFYFYRVESTFLAIPEESITSEVRDEPQRFSGFFTRSTILPLILALVSLLFLINPTISKDAKLSSFVSSKFQVSNTDVRPSLSATLNISKAVLSQVTLLGSGPNTFGADWLIYKPVAVNSTPFWSVAFPFGVGFIPTQVATTGILGTFIWVIFFILLLGLGLKSFNRIPQARSIRFTLVASFFISLILWVSSILYSPSETMLMLAFIFAGIFLSVCRETGVIPHSTFNFKESTQSRFIAMVVLVAVTVGALTVGWVSGRKALASYHFNKASNLANTANVPIDQIEGELDQAVKLAPLDTYYLAISRLNFSKATAAAQSATGTPEKNKKIFEDALAKSIEAGKSATAVNSANYLNWANLGEIYTAMVPPPLQVPGAYENATLALNEAGKRNPTNPEIQLLLARLEIAKGNVDAARSHLQSAVALKNDYADAYILSAQLEIQQKNVAGAISSTEVAANLLNNAGLYFELGVLKFAANDFQGAATALRKSLSLTPDYANAKFYLGLTLAKLGNYEEAISIYEDLDKSNPGNTDVKAALEALHKLNK